MSVWIKICGLTSHAAVRAALEAGVDAVGFVFYAPSPRNVTPSQAASLARAVPAGVLKVAVAQHPPQALVDAIAAEFAPDLLQTDCADLASLSLPPGLAVLPVLRSGQRLPARLPARCLYESATSGAGREADWPAACELAGRTELILGGGLRPENVAAAIAAVQPFGVDVSSGVESAPGIKDAARIQAFVAAARGTAVRQATFRE
ncbi:MAG TPA: phosphoribosylanthranilate isomerase [Steroidobacteraceae bacterium]|nr:phosphoribosylanthranilate isomerase [Steroidobacteraceae bacterium]